MKRVRAIFRLISLTAAVTFAHPAAAQTTNSWTAVGNGKWETAGNWSAGTPASSHAANLITNTGNKVVTIDATTTNVAPGSLTISNLVMTSFAVPTNTLNVTGIGRIVPFRVRNSFSISAAAAIVDGSDMFVDGVSGGQTLINGSLNVTTGGRFFATNTAVNVADGTGGSGSLTVSGGLMLLTSLNVAANAFSFQSGTLDLSSGEVALSGNLTVGGGGGFDSSFGQVWVTGGQLVVTNGSTVLGTISSGPPGFGDLTVSNAGVLARDVILGTANGCQGTLTVAGGTNRLSSFLTVGAGAGAAGAVFVNGGVMTVTNGPTLVGSNGVGQVTVNGGRLLVTNTTVGVDGGSQGTWTVAGGTNQAFALFTVGNAPGSTGEVWVTGGEMVLTNGITGIGQSGVGSLTVSNGLLRVSALNIAQSVGGRGTFTMTGGSVIQQAGAGFGMGANSITATGTVWISGGTLRAGQQTTVGGLGVGRLTVSNGTVSTSSLIVGFSSSSQGTLTMAGGSFEITNAAHTAVTDVRRGAVTIQGGTLTCDNLILTNSSGQFNLNGGTLITRGATVSNTFAFIVPSGGTWNAVAGSHLFNDIVQVASGATATITNASARVIGQLFLDGDNTFQDSTVVATNIFSFVGGATVGSSGRLIVDNSTFLASDLTVGQFSMSEGSLRIGSGGNVTVLGPLSVGLGGVFAPSTGVVGIASGELVVTNGTTIIGDSQFAGEPGYGLLQVNGGKVLARDMSLARGSNSQGTMGLDGGNVCVFSNLTVGDCAINATGTVTIAAGSGLFVTNAAVTSTLDLRGGTLTLNGGTLVVDILYITNTCSRFINNGGTFGFNDFYQLAPDGDADGDGIPNDYELANGLDPLSFMGVNGAEGDKDGDGQNNLPEYLAGTQANNNLSSLRIISIANEGPDTRVTWTTVGGKTYFLEAVTNAPSGNFTNDFVPIGPLFVVPGMGGESTTNYPDPGAVTNGSARYYRVRLPTD